MIGLQATLPSQWGVTVSQGHNQPVSAHLWTQISTANSQAARPCSATVHQCSARTNDWPGQYAGLQDMVYSWELWPNSCILIVSYTINGERRERDWRRWHRRGHRLMSRSSHPAPVAREGHWADEVIISSDRWIQVGSFSMWKQKPINAVRRWQSWKKKQGCTESNHISVQNYISS